MQAVDAEAIQLSPVQNLIHFVVFSLLPLEAVSPEGKAPRGLSFAVKEINLKPFAITISSSYITYTDCLYCIKDIKNIILIICIVSLFIFVDKEPYFSVII